MIDPVERTAYHEAGHVVAAMVHGIRFKYATILQNKAENSLGHVRYSRRFFGRRNSEFFSKKTFIKHGIITLAGICAEKVKYGSYSPDGFGDDDYESDRSSAIECFIRAGIEDVHPYLLKTEDLLKGNWIKVEYVALALLERKTLQYSEIRDRIND